MRWICVSTLSLSLICLIEALTFLKVLPSNMFGFQVPEAVIHAVVDRKAILLEDNMSRKACRNKQRCDAWEEVRRVAEAASSQGTVSLDMVKGIFKYRQMKIRRIYEDHQQ